MPPKAVPVVWGPNGVIPSHVRQDPDPREAVVQRVVAVPPVIPPPPPAPPAGGPPVAPAALIPGFPEVLYTKFHPLAGPNLRLWNDTVHYRDTAIGIGPPVRVSELQVVGRAVRSPGKS